MIYNASDIKNQLSELGLKSSDKFIVHTSFSAVAPLEDGLNTLFEGFKLLIGSEGTVMVPGLSYVNVNIDSPVFDVRDTPCCTGAFPEFFRNQPGVVRSLHPTHSIIAFGKDAVRLTKDHIKDTTPAGKNSPLRLISKEGGKILMLGCGMCPNTSMHSVEELCPPPYLFCRNKVTYTVIDYDGVKHESKHTVHDFHTVKSQRYDRAANFLTKEEFKKGKVGNADAYLIDSGAMFEKCGAVIQERPNSLVDLIGE